MTPLDRMRAVLDAEAAAIEAVTLTSDYETAVARIAASHNLACVGKVVTTGMGKAGLVARAVAATFCSTGTRSVFLHPGEAAHGDLGVLGDGDVILAFSTSGKTAEVIEALEAARRVATVIIIGVTSHPDTPFRGACNYVLDMGVIEEPCPLGLTPTASTAAMLAIGHALALAVLEQRGFTRSDFAVRHRAGYLGQVATQ